MQTLVPFNPLKFKQVRFVPWYAPQAAVISTQPAPLVTHPAKAFPHAVSVVRVAARSVQILFAHVVVHVHALR